MTGPPLPTMKFSGALVIATLTANAGLTTSVCVEAGPKPVSAAVTVGSPAIVSS